MLSPKNTPQPRQTTSHPLRRVGRGLLIGFLGMVALVILAVAALTLYISPRLTEIVNRHASEYFYADIHTADCRFTLWSTFPHLCLEVDSLKIVSRTLPKYNRGGLPASADSLASIDRLRGSVNVLAMLAGRIELGDVTTEGLDLNLVTLNDSVNNFNIIPQSDDQAFRVPYVSVRRLAMRDVKGIRLYSAESGFSVKAVVDSAGFNRAAKDRYNLAIHGSLSARVDSLDICDNIPFLFGGRVNLAFNPFSVRIHDMKMNLANTVSHISMGMNFGDKSELNNFSTEMSAFDLMRLLEYIPSRFLPELKGLDTDLRAGISIHLTKPYRFSSGGLPSFVVELTVPSSSLTYTLDTGERYTVNDITVSASIYFTGDDWRHSYCDIGELKARGEGLALLLNGHIADLFADARLKTNVEVNVDMAAVASGIRSLRAWQPRGKGAVDLHIDVPVSMLNETGYRSIPFDGTVALRDMAVTMPDGTSLTADALGIRLNNGNGRPLQVSAQLDGIAAELGAGGHISSPRLTAEAVGADDVARIRFALADTKINTIPVNASASSLGGTVTLSEKSQDASIGIGTLKLTAGGKTPVSTVADGAVVSFDRRGASPLLSLAVNNLTADISRDMKLSAKGVKIASSDFKTWNVGASTSRFAMTDGTVDATLDDWKGSVTPGTGVPEKMALKIVRGRVMTNYYNAPIYVSAVNAEAAGLSRFNIRSLVIRDQMSRVAMRGTFDINRSLPKPFYTVRGNIDFDTLHFNQIARHIVGSNDIDSTASSTDSLPVKYNPFLVPSNFDIDLNLSAMATVYTDLWLTDLGARIRMKEGLLSLDTVYLSADFGHAAASAQYLSPDAQHLSLGVKASVSDFDLTKFFRSYPNVLAMMPQMANLHGLFTADASCHTEIFPDMDFNTASMTAVANIGAHDMYVHQNHFIRHLARMALIRQPGDIHIPAIHAQLRVYDHLLTLSPVDIYLDRYHFRALGRNDFSGDLYYHIAVLRNPFVPLKFGIDVRGKYSHPKLRFSGVKYSIGRAEAIDSIDVGKRINLIDEARYYGLMLLNHAAKAKILSSDPYGGPDR